jgi:hypothetical protein
LFKIHLKFQRQIIGNKKKNIPFWLSIIYIYNTLNDTGNSINFLRKEYVKVFRHICIYIIMNNPTIHQNCPKRQLFVGLSHKIRNKLLKVAFLGIFDVLVELAVGRLTAFSAINYFCKPRWGHKQWQENLIWCSQNKLEILSFLCYFSFILH